MKSLVMSICLLVSVTAGFTQTNAAAVPDLARLQTEIKGARSLTWVITGDSITHGAKWLGRERSCPEIINERIRWEMGRYRDMLINSGITGEKAPGLLADFDWRVLRFQPDVVSVMIGMNDSAGGPAGREKFSRALREMVHRIRAAGAIPILNRTNPIDTGRDPSRSDLPAYNEIIAQVASEEKVILVDHWTYWHQACPDLASLHGWLANSIHPNAAGHRQMAILFFKTLGIYDPKAPTCQP